MNNNFYNNSVPEINLIQNVYFSNDDKSIENTPCQYDFYNNYVQQAQLPYVNNIIMFNMFLDKQTYELKEKMLIKLIEYKFNNFTFNYNTSLFYNKLKYLFSILQNTETKENNIKILEFIESLKEQIKEFNKKLIDLLPLLQSITTQIHENYIFVQLNHFLNALRNIVNNIFINNIIRTISQQSRDFNNQITQLHININNIIQQLTRINSLHNHPIEYLSEDKKDQIKKYFSILLLLYELFQIFTNPANPNPPFKPIEDDTKKKFIELHKYYKLLNKIYKVKDLQIITANLDQSIKQTERNELLNVAINNKNQLFGHYKPTQYKRVFLPYYIRIENIVQIIKLRINDQMTQEQLEVFIYNYNTFFYEIVIGDDNNKNFYMKQNSKTNKNYFKIPINYIYDQSRILIFNNYLQPNYINRILTRPNLTIPNPTRKQIEYIYIPITQEINKIYDDIIKQILFDEPIIPKGEYLKYYNKKKFKIQNIYVELTNKTYYFTFIFDGRVNKDIHFSLYDLNKNEKLIETPLLPLQIYYTDYKYSYTQPNIPNIQNIDINILTFYEDIYKDPLQKTPNMFGNIQTEYNLYILLEQIKKKSENIYIEDFTLYLMEDYNNYKLKNTSQPNYYKVEFIDQLLVYKDNIINLFNPPNLLEQETDYFYANEKSKEIIYKESKRRIIMIRLFNIILYVARIYHENNKVYFQNYQQLHYHFENYKNNFNDNNRTRFLDEIIAFFTSNITNIRVNRNLPINTEFITSIIDGSLFSKEKDLFIKKQNVLEKSIETATENIENIASEMDKFIKIPTDPSLKGFDALKDTYDKVSTDVMSKMSNVMDYLNFQKEPDYTNTPIEITGFEEKNFSLTADVLENRIKKWITGPIYEVPSWIYPNISVQTLNFINNTFVCPDVIQFISEYLNNKSGTDLISIKNKEQICKNISLIKNTIEKNTSEIKYILPKTFFDDETFMTKYSKKVDETYEKTNNKTN